MSAIAAAAPAAVLSTQRNVSRGTSSRLNIPQKKAVATRATFRTNAVATSPATDEKANTSGACVSLVYIL